MARPSLRAVALGCLVVWAAVWGLFALIRFTGFDLRVIPGIGPIMLASLVLAVIGPGVAIVVAGLALLRQPTSLVTWLILGGALAACLTVGLLFAVNRWL